jgi:ribose 5-phosphate isomerase B
MRISVGADQRTNMVSAVMEELAKAGHIATYTGPLEGIPDNSADNYWPVIARRVAEDIVNGLADEGILICWTGTGMSIAANKIKGIRAALCADAQTARGSRLWNNANLLCLSLRATSEEVAKEILEAWFETGYQSNSTDDACLALVEELEQM